MSYKKIVNWAMPYIKNFRSYIDIGANDGDTAVPFIDKFEKIFAFEPNPNTYIKIPEPVQKYNIALADYIGEAQLKIPSETNNPEHGSIAQRRNKNWDGQSYTVDVNLLDNFDIKDVDFIKIDVEQGELEVIKGAMKTISTYKPTIMFENKRNENDIVIEILKKLDYKIIKHGSDTIAYFDK